MRKLGTLLKNKECNFGRSRIIYLLLTLTTMCFGLVSRKYINYLPSFIGKYAGDTLWATMVYLGLAFLFNRFNIRKIIIFSLIFSYGIEISQLYQGEWINKIRNTLIGALILGRGFLFSDLICYTVGIFIGIIIDKLIFRIKFD
ncbi:ribosomal maturation YjgA family protein [Clostridium tertium]|jgi:hypothetical protein|uniref:ribosomal maturation YjgA family protein n=1 Tax=Clostridium tertium TaxID=1559 RepID=UPI000BE2337D|nr:DUF2809 domain-containing protein [Clostridium tertium]MBU6136051.1 DUF2809 domain-containing protein [Clostridium tertium]MDU1568315.1 DUF2809 domain-containing protein [Clostridium sp.]